METMQTILTRRSVREYAKQDVSNELIETLLRAGMNAPSAGNQQPWHFVVIRDRSILNDIAEVHPYAKMLHEAPVAIAVCGDTEVERHKGYWIQDCSAAVENILLAAHASGLGAVWLGVTPREDRIAEIKKILNLPPNVMPLAVISMGYAAEKIPPADRFDPKKIHQNKW